jgi:ATP-dependent DNA helicase RecG
VVDLSALLAAPESETVECKEAWDDDALKALAALANTRGGTLLVGVADDRRRSPGWHGDGREQERISNQITSTLHVHPVSMTIESLHTTPVLAVQMSRAASPVGVRGRYYRRVGNSTREVPAEELPRFLLEHTGQSWDAIPGDFRLDDLAPRTLSDFKAMAQARLPAISPANSLQDMLNNLRLTAADGRLLRSALLLFGRDPQRLVPSAQIQIGRFKDDATILDDRRIEGNLLQQLEQVVQALRHYLFVRYEIPTGMGERTGVQAVQRDEIWEYPFGALREAVINALVHRDYTSTGRVQIRLCDDRVVITNPGGLPEGLTVGHLVQEPHPSLPRNPILAQVFYYANLVEQWGTGTIRMLRACQAQGLPPPEFESTPTQFSVTFRKDILTDERLRRMGLTARQVSALRYIRERGSISNSEHQALTGVARRTAARDLEDLENLGLVTRSAQTGRAVRYMLSTAPNVPNVP